MSKFQKGDRVKFAGVSKLLEDVHGTVVDPHWFSGGTYYVKVAVDEPRRGSSGGWFEDQLELAARPGEVLAFEPTCPNCGKKAAPEHVADGKARCWWCETR